MHNLRAARVHGMNRGTIQEPHFGNEWIDLMEDVDRMKQVTEEILNISCSNGTKCCSRLLTRINGKEKEKDEIERKVLAFARFMDR
jgi:hypothetical protein